MIDVEVFENSECPECGDSAPMIINGNQMKCTNHECEIVFEP